MSIIAQKHKVLIGQAKAMFRDLMTNIMWCEDEDQLNRYLESQECLKIMNILEEVLPDWVQGNDDYHSLEERIEKRRKELTDVNYG